VAVNFGDDNKWAQRVANAIGEAEQHYTKPEGLKDIDHRCDVHLWVGDPGHVRVTHVFTLQLLFREEISQAAIDAADDETLRRMCAINLIKVHMSAAEIFKDVKLPRKP